MKLRSFIFLLSFLFLANTTANANDVYKVIKVVDGDTFYVDFNNNNIADKDERVRLNGIDAFETRNNEHLNYQLNKFKFTNDELLKLGYLGKYFAIKTLLNKNVRIKYTAPYQLDNYGRKIVSVYHGLGYLKNFEEEILKNGLATVYDKSNLAEKLNKFLDSDKIEKNAKRNINIGILNLDNNKIHKITCSYGQNVFNSQILINAKDFKKYKYANCCNKEITTKENNKKLKDDGNIKFYYIRARDYDKPSQETRTNAGKALVEIINNAKSTIDFAFYGLSGQNEILEALLQAQNRGVKIRGIVDLNTNKTNDYPETLESIAKFKNNTVKTDYKADILKKEATKDIKSPYGEFRGHIMHNKFCIVDKKYVWTGTANISPTGTGGYNENAVILINSEKIADLYKLEMDEMYNNEHFHEYKKEIYSHNPIMLNDIEARVYFSPTSTAVEQGIIPEIRKAKKYIYLSVFLISHYDIARELVWAKNRGVDVKIITEANHAQQKYSKHEYLRKNGIPVKVENWGGKMHAKMALIDDETIIIGSTNWTKTGFLYNDENMLILKNALDGVKYFKNEFISSYNSIGNKWLNSNPQPESPDSIGSCFDGIDNNHNKLIDSEEPFCKL